MTYRDALDWLYSTQLFGIKLGLENMRRLCDAIGIALERPKFIHVAGTNGKGSVCAFAESVARSAGLCTGLYTSPHLIAFEERIQIDGVPIDRDELAAALTTVRSVIGGWDPHPTFFEIATVVALAHFQKGRTDVVLLETGMGGRLDATNVVTPAAAAITPISLDHQQWLGESLAAIAGEKAGILKPDIPAVVAHQDEEASQVIREHAKRTGATLISPSPLPDLWETGIPGLHQRENAATAVATLAAAGIEPDELALKRGVASTRWPARFQQVEPRTVVDGAHNPAAARALAATWQEIFGEEKACIVFGAVDSKDIPGVLAPLEGIAGSFVFTQPNSPRAVPAGSFTTLHPSVVSEDVSDALTRARSGTDRTLVTGSLYLAGEALAILQGHGDTFQSSAQ